MRKNCYTNFSLLSFLSVLYVKTNFKPKTVKEKIYDNSFKKHFVLHKFVIKSYVFELEYKIRIIKKI